MAASWKGRALALGAPLLLAVALAVGVSGRGCDESDAGPADAVLMFLDAAAEIDRETMFAGLGPRTRAHLEAAAREATDRSSRRYTPAEMIGIDSALDVFDLDGARDFARVEESTSETAIVSIRDRRGRTHRLSLVKSDGRWLLELIPDR